LALPHTAGKLTFAYNVQGSFRAIVLACTSPAMLEAKSRWRSPWFAQKISCPTNGQEANHLISFNPAAKQLSGSSFG